MHFVSKIREPELPEISINAITVYPNPTTSHITIDIDEKINSVKIFNITGDLVQTETSNTFSVENLSTGVYIINVVTSKGLNYSRFIKE